MVNGINIEFGKKKKSKEDGTTAKKKRKRDQMEEKQPPVTPVPFKKQSCFFKYLSYWKELDTPHAILVSMKDLTLTSFNAHDCDIMLMVFLPIVIRAIGPEYMKMVITRLS